MRSQNVSEKRLGVFGGTFDPPHWGHLIIAEMAREQLDLDKVIFVPAFMPPHKTIEDGATAAQRLQMLKKAIQGNSKFMISPVELRRKGISYTADTLLELKARYPSYKLFLILGSDNLLEFDMWKSPMEILANASIVVYDRKDYDLIGSTVVARIRPIRLSSMLIDISSSMIRRRVKEGKSVRYLVPALVEKYIRSKGLYQVD